jgi:hypothetical protein
MDSQRPDPFSDHGSRSSRNAPTREYITARMTTSAVLYILRIWEIAAAHGQGTNIITRDAK